jgi:trk system potassium uptake protein TrkA
VQETLDVLAITGDIKDPNSYKAIDIERVDLFIGVTNNDESNIIASAIIDGIFDVKEKIVRVQNKFYKDTNIKEKLNIQKLIMPSLISSKSIKSLINYPKVNNIKSFKDSPYKLISVYATKDFEQDELDEYLDKDRELILGIERDKNFFITNNTQIFKGDLIYILTHQDSIQKVSNLFNKELPGEINRCVVFGCNEVGIEVAKVLIENKKSVKIIDKNIQACNLAYDELLGKAEIINSIYHKDSELFIEEGINSAEFFISTYKSDEYNIIKCLEAKEIGIKKVVATNNESSYYNLMHALKIVTIRGPKMSAYHKILEEINSSNIIYEKYFCGGKGVIFFRKVFNKLAGKKISIPKYKECLFFAIIDNKIEPLNKELSLNSLVIAVCTKDMQEQVRRWIYEL